jgi:hypothetical protein
MVGKLEKSDVKRLLAESIEDLDEEDVRKLLINAAVSDASVHIKVWEELTDIQISRKNERPRNITAQRYPPIDLVPQAQQAQQVNRARSPTPLITFTFDANIEQVDHIINERWARLSNTEKYNRTGDAADLVKKEVATIAQSITKRSRYDTKIDAINALCEIRFLVGMGSAELRRQAGYYDTLINTTVGIADLMTIYEKRAFVTESLEALGGFRKERQETCVLDYVEDILDVIKKTLVVPSTATWDLDDDENNYSGIISEALPIAVDAIKGSASQSTAT